jgi:outer membrane protein TolC
MFDSWESALQAAADAFEKAVETAVKAYEKAMSGIHGSFDAMQTAYDRQTTLNERYLEDYEKIYELSKLNR